jgi:hypothetical protein
MMKGICFAALAALAAPALGQVIPTHGHSSTNALPFYAGQQCTYHQVISADHIRSLTGGLPAHITRIGFAPMSNGVFHGQVWVSMGYTNAIPGAPPNAGGLQIPAHNHQNPGEPNANGRTYTFYYNNNHVVQINQANGNTFHEFQLPGSFVYEPWRGNLLVVISTNVSPNSASPWWSHAVGSPQASRAFYGGLFYGWAEPTAALRMEFQMTPIPMRNPSRAP